MALVASGIQIPDDLRQSFGNIGGNAQSSIGGIYSGLGATSATDAKARGVKSGSYAAQRLPIQQGLDIGSLHAALGGQLGTGSYQDALNQRDYQQKRDIAEQTADLNKPSLLDQLLRGFGRVGKVGAEAYGAFGANNKNNTGGSTSPSPVSMYDSSGEYNA